jgi:hypothetical protein
MLRAKANRAQHNVVEIDENLGQPQDAEPLLRSCLHLHQRVLAKGHWCTARLPPLRSACVEAGSEHRPIPCGIKG